MTVLSALTPPGLVLAVVIVAIVAFLRHEMGGSRRRGDPDAVDEAEAEAEAQASGSAAPGGPDGPGQLPPAAPPRRS